MSIKLVLRCFKLFILFLLIFFQHLHVELYTPTPTCILLKIITCIILENCHDLPLLSNLYSWFSIIILPNCLNMNLFCHCACFVCLFVYISNISSKPCKNMCNKLIKVTTLCKLTILCVYSLVYICGASSRKPYNVGENIFFFLADLNSPDTKL